MMKVVRTVIFPDGRKVLEIEEQFGLIGETQARYTYQDLNGNRISTVGLAKGYWGRVEGLKF